MTRYNSNTDKAPVAARHRSIHTESEVPFIVRRHVDAFSLRAPRVTPSIDSLWDMTLLDRLQMPFTRRY